MAKRPVYVSIDIEADGPCPGLNSMLSLGAVAFNEKGREIDQFWINFDPIEGGIANLETMEWWNKQDRQIWEAIRRNTEKPERGMKEFSDWARKLPGKPTAVAYPAGYDFSWLYWYLMTFVGESPFGFVCLDIKTLMSVALKRPFREASKKNASKTFPEWFQDEFPHTHLPVDDAREQGHLFFAIKRTLGIP